MASVARALVCAASGSMVWAFVESDVAYTGGQRKLEGALREMMAASNGPPMPEMYAAPSATPSALPPLALYDCTAEYYDWKHLWTPEWKRWCCENKNRGCDTEADTPAPKASQETTAKSTTAKSTTDKPTKAATTSAPSTTEDTAAKTTAAITTRSVAAESKAAPPFEACEEMCTFESVQYSCRDRMLWALSHYVKNADDKCQTAHDMVEKQCGSACRSCTEKAAGLHGAMCVDLYTKDDISFHLRQPQRAGAPSILNLLTLLGVAAVVSASGLILAAFSRVRASSVRHASYQQLTRPLQ